jgi:hypothetical protein
MIVRLKIAKTGKRAVGGTFMDAAHASATCVTCLSETSSFRETLELRL